MGVNSVQKQEIIREVFETSTGLISAKDLEEFDRKAINLVTKMRSVSDVLRKHLENKVIPNIREHIVIPRIKHKFLPVRWTNNNCESLNRTLKQVVNWRPQKIIELIEALHAVVKLQEIDMRRALHGQGCYELHPRVSKLYVNDMNWQSKTKEEKDKICQKLFKWKPKKDKVVMSTDGKLAIPKTPNTARKPGQRRRPRAEKANKKS